MYPSVREPKVTQQTIDDLTKGIMAFESSGLESEEVDALFQKLIDTGVIEALQGTYQRIAIDLIRAGRCHLPIRIGGETLGR